MNGRETLLNEAKRLIDIAWRKLIVQHSYCSGMFLFLCFFSYDTSNVLMSCSSDGVSAYGYPRILLCLDSIIYEVEDTARLLGIGSVVPRGGQGERPGGARRGYRLQQLGVHAVGTERLIHCPLPRTLAHLHTWWAWSNALA